IKEEKDMGIGIGSGQGGIMYGGTERKVIKNGNRVTTKTIFRRADGSYAGAMSVTKSAPKKTKRLNYNFKEISAMILQTKTSGSARQVAGRARGKVALLKQRLKCGEYDDKELEAAIIHAEKMERIARKRMRHLQEEEMTKRGGPCFGELEEECDDIQPEEEAEQEEELELDRKQQDAMLQKRQQEIQQEMQRMMREMEQAQRDFEQEMSELSDLDELSDALGGGVARDMDPEDLDALKKKHRLDEQREIMEADMAYLKVLFNKLAQEKQQGSSGTSGSSGSGGSYDGSSYDGSSGVSLELGGMEMPVETAEAPVMPEGGSIDTTV
ncbi:MAG: DUF4175 domain-containing protein, partial [Acetatifactor sp.]|nr:DUF4175 domain-containing protein [Acetatifactor sp.]